MKYHIAACLEVERVKVEFLSGRNVEDLTIKDIFKDDI